MADKGSVGLTLHLDQVPLRDETMEPEEILLSESQERMLLICEPSRYEELKSVFEHWGLDAVSVGEVIEEPVIRLIWKNETLTEMSPKDVVDNAPQYERDYQPWTRKDNKDLQWVSTESENLEELKEILSSHQGGTKEWIYKQYDQRVGSSTARDCQSPVGVSALPSGRGLGLVLGCRPHIMRQDAWVGGMDSIAYPAIELAAKGFEALATTDCLNFGNPEKPEVMSEFVASLDGMSKACESFVTPIISGNVSFYNETLDKGISPTPSTGLVGLRPHLKNMPESFFTKEGESLLLVQLGEGVSTGFWSEIKTGSGEIHFDQDLKRLAQDSKKLMNAVLDLPVSSTRIVSSFGLAYTLAKMSFEKNLSVEVETKAPAFFEPLYQVVVSTGNEKAWMEWADQEGLKVEKIGKVSQSNQWKWNETSLSLDELKDCYNGSWQKALPGL